jgi:hypothetical protein
LSDFFIENRYQSEQNKTIPCYLITRKGCEMVANKMTGAKGVQFTAAYINRFHAMEGALKSGSVPAISKDKRLEVMEKNARNRAANLYMRIAENDALPRDYRGVFLSYASRELSGENILPLPKAERETYSASYIGAMFGVSSQRIGKLANANGLKTDAYGQLYHDKSRYSAKEVDTFRYYDSAIPRFRALLQSDRD